MAKVDELDAARDACLALVNLCGAFLWIVRDLYTWNESKQTLQSIDDEIRRGEYARGEPFCSLLMQIDKTKSLACQAFEKVRLNLLAVAADRCAHQQIIEQADTILKVAGFEFVINGRIAELDAGRTLKGMMCAMLWPAWGRDAWPEIDVEAAPQRIAVEHAKALAPAAPAGEVKPVDEGNGSPPVIVPRAVQYLIGWPEILDRIGQRDDAKDRIAVFNRNYSGPVITRQGAAPKVDAAELVVWWNGLKDRWLEESALSNEVFPELETYQHGRTETVVPEIGGHETKRVKGRNAK